MSAPAKARVVTIVVLLVFVWAYPLSAQGSAEANPSGISVVGSSVTVSGFGDVVASTSATGDPAFRLGQAELDFDAAIDRRTGISVALALDESSMVLGAFTIDLALLERKDSRPGPWWALESVVLSAGQFDVPFGIDWRVYPSIDRKLVSSPLVVEYTHGCWNDYGVQARFDGSRGNAVVFATNGFSCHVDGNHDALDNDSDFAAGARTGLEVTNGLEFGVSFAYVAGGARAHDIELLGLDAQGEIGRFSGRAEVITRRSRVEELGAVSSYGYYVEGMATLGDWFIVHRFDAVSVEPESLYSSRHSTGIGRAVSERVEIRTELQLAPDTEPVVLGQVVAGF